LWEYAEKYGKVLLKPSGGGGGAGILQLVPLGGERYRIHAGKRLLYAEGKEKTVNVLKSLFRPKLYLLQPCLSLGRIGGRPFDIRVMVQRMDSRHPWKVTGWLAKLAGPGFVVTNIARSRGKVLPLRAAIRLSNIPASPDLFLNIRRLSLAAARCLGKTYPTLREIGLDLGVDTEGKLWIIEANFRPALSLFLKLPSRSQYQKIKAMRLKKA
jgi:hypothetical protein